AGKRAALRVVRLVQHAVAKRVHVFNGATPQFAGPLGSNDQLDRLVEEQDIAFRGGIGRPGTAAERELPQYGELVGGNDEVRMREYAAGNRATVDPAEMTAVHAIACADHG